MVGRPRSPYHAYPAHQASKGNQDCQYSTMPTHLSSRSCRHYPVNIDVGPALYKCYTNDYVQCFLGNTSVISLLQLMHTLILTYYKVNKCPINALYSAQRYSQLHSTRYRTRYDTCEQCGSFSMYSHDVIISSAWIPQSNQMSHRGRKSFVS